MTTRGIDIRQATGQIVFRTSLKDSGGDKVTSGTTELRLYRAEDDGTLDVYDWTTNDFVATGSGTPDDETTMSHQQRRDSTGADVDTGIWTKVLSTLTNFTAGQIYIAQITNTGAAPESQEREFQFGGGVAADLVEIGSTAQSATDLKHFADSGYDPATTKIEGLKLADTLTTYTGNTPQTGDSYALANGASGFVPTKTVLDTAAADVANIDGAAMRGTDWAYTGTPPSASTIAAAVLAAGDVDGFTLEETLKLCLAALAGKVSGAATTTITIRAADDSADRITATVDADGNRSAVTLNETG